MLAKTAQKHDYPSAAWRRSYARRSGAERGFATIKDPAASDIARGWCRLMGLAPLMLFTVTLLAVRNQRILTAWNARQEENPPRRQGPAPENPQAPPQGTHRAHTRRAALTAARPRHQHEHDHHDSASMPAHASNTPNSKKGACGAPSQPARTGLPPARNVRPKRELDLTET